MSLIAKKLVTNLFNSAGVKINGDNPWDIQVNNDRFYRRTLRGSLGFGESYMDGDWDVQQLDELFSRIIRTNLTGSGMVKINRLWLDLKSRLVNLQSRRGSMAIVETHYDLDHQLYEKFLGPYNQYTCCFFKRATTLEDAEKEKLEMLCNKLALGPEDKVLDIGCGWGGFARYAAETRGCHVTGVSISTEQIAYAREFTDGLAVDIVKADYRDLPDIYPAGHFDKVLICGMIEHVGYKNYRGIMLVIDQVMKDDGHFLLHTIGNSQDTTVCDPWLEKYIFRNSMLPSIAQLAGAFQDIFVVQAWENYGHYYAPTLAAWYEKFERNWDSIKEIKALKPFDEKFRRMFDYYLLSCKAGFETEFINLWQVVLTKKGLGKTVYDRVNLMASS